MLARSDFTISARITLAVGFALLAGLNCSAQRANQAEFFEKQIRPVLAQQCLSCHNDKIQSGGLRLDTHSGLLKGGEHGPAISIGSAAAGSLLLKAIEQSGSIKMPPGKKLPASDIEAFQKWVRGGAAWPDVSASITASPAASHWAFRPLRRVVPPPVHAAARVRDPIDRLVFAKIESAGKSTAPDADGHQLLRRLSYNLTGLAPTPEELTAYEIDHSPDRYLRAVDRLLASARFGEQWGRHWLDVVRYADTAGENTDHPLPHAWRYRNWVIDALNANLPYNQFIRDQIAGDLLAKQKQDDRYGSHVVATGYLAIARRFGHDIDQDMNLTMDDTIDTLGKSVLGLTLGCARCHDHKFDPVTAKDYYGLYGIFSSTRFSYPGCEPHQEPRDLIPLIAPELAAKRTKEAADERTKLQAQLSGQASIALKQARDLKAAAVPLSTVIAEGEVPDGGARELKEGAKRSLDALTANTGDVLQLSISPLMSHGADSTLVDMTIEEIGGRGRKWSTSDLVDNLSSANPRADRFGNSATWYFLDAQDGFAMLPESMAAVESRGELSAWRNGDTPSVFANSSTQPVKVWTTLAARSFFMHPGQRGPVALAWVCPPDLSGQIRIHGHITDAHPGGPDGIGYRMEIFHGQFGGKPISALYTELGSQLHSQLGARKRLAELDLSAAVPVAYGAVDGLAADAKLQKRGDPANLGDAVPRKFIDLLGGDRLRDPASSGRLELADWLTRPSNPLASRVIVNRIWQWTVGVPIVATPNDFGTRGAAPTNPELLDYLASEFIRSGWNIKSMVRRIALSSAFRMSAVTSAKNGQIERFARRRLTTEEIRDAMLAASGDLDLKPGEAHPFPAESSWHFSQHAPFADEYSTTKRSVYMMQKRNRRIRFFAIFDGPDPNSSTPVRDLTTVPTQALYFMNDPFVHDRASRMAARLIGSKQNDAARLDLACKLLYSRPVTAGDLADMDAYKKSLHRGLEPTAFWSAYCRILFASNEFLYLD